VVDSSDARDAALFVARSMWDIFHPAPRPNHEVDEIPLSDDDVENLSANSVETEEDPDQEYSSHNEGEVAPPVVKKVD
jgi:hypothetical protein